MAPLFAKALASALLVLAPLASGHLTVVSTAATCAQESSCSSCTNAQIGDCGWAADIRTCLPGTSSGPSPPYTSQDWAWVSAQCGAAECKGDSTCEACTSFPHCGWTNNATCLPGNSTGPFPMWKPSSGVTSWAWKTCVNPTTFAPSVGGCASFSTCSSCTDAPSGDCGWAADLRLCLAGTGLGPSGGYTSQDWAWVAPQCAAAECKGDSTCEGCTTLPHCGWTNNATCLPGNSTGPFPVWAPPSSVTSWAWKTCVGPTLSPSVGGCINFGTCSSCTHAPSGDCGWAADLRLCLAGTASGPSGGYTSQDWAWVAQQCSAAECKGDSTCEGCTTLPHCGWTNNVTCLPGNSAGPFPVWKPTSGVTSWAFGTCAVPTVVPTLSPSVAACIRFGTCASCTNAQVGDCGWAVDLRTCLPGTSTGPSPPYTSQDWAWVAVECNAADCEHSTCGSCTSLPHCGWTNNATCLPGNSTGPFPLWAPSSGVTSWAWGSCSSSSLPVPGARGTVSAHSGIFRIMPAPFVVAAGALLFLVGSVAAGTALWRQTQRAQKPSTSHTLVA